MHQPEERKLKIALIIVLIGGTLALHYSTIHDQVFRHAVYRMLFYLPLVLGSFWFGLRGAVLISASVTVFYLPYGLYRWRSFSHDYNLLLEGGLYVCIALILGYLSEREKREQAARLEAERLASIGRAVAEIAHDMKSPLMAIGGFVTQVSRKLPAEESSRKKLDLVIRETSRLESMVKDMLDFGRPLELRLQEEDLNRLADECLQACRPIAENRGVGLQKKLNSEMPSLPLDENRMKQVLMNLITNAVQASSPGDSVLVETRKNRYGVVLEVADSGSGIPEEDRDKIFEPFYSTKKEGTGLGLPIVKKIMEAHGGSISLHSNPEGGVTFSVWLPAET
ncbi:MAG: ATP-binding protein [Desulfatiglandales bacterium]